MEELGTQTTKKAAQVWVNHFSQLSSQNQGLFNNILEKRIPPATLFQMIHLNQSYLKLLQQIIEKPEPFVASQATYWQELFIVWQRLMRESQDNFIFHFINEYYRLHVDYFLSLLTRAEALDEKTRQRLHLDLKQLSEALAPENFTAQNPEVWQATVEAKGKKLLQDLDSA